MSPSQTICCVFRHSQITMRRSERVLAVCVNALLLDRRAHPAPSASEATGTQLPLVPFFPTLILLSLSLNTQHYLSILSPSLSQQHTRILQHTNYSLSLSFFLSLSHTHTISLSSLSLSPLTHSLSLYHSLSLSFNSSLLSLLSSLSLSLSSVGARGTEQWRFCRQGDLGLSGTPEGLISTWTPCLKKNLLHCTLLQKRGKLAIEDAFEVVLPEIRTVLFLSPVYVS